MLSLKGTPPAGLLAAIRVVVAGDALLAPGSPGGLSRSSPGYQKTPLRPMAALDHITEREREVLTLSGLGLSTTEIAAYDAGLVRPA